MVARSTRTIVLAFNPALDVLPNGKRLSEGLSAAVAVADTLWLAHDETVAIERLTAERTKAGGVRYARHRRFHLQDLVALPVPGIVPGRSLFRKPTSKASRSVTTTFG